MTFDPTQHGGRTQEQVERNEAACETVWTTITLFLLFNIGVSVGGWLVEMVAGWLI